VVIGADGAPLNGLADLILRIWRHPTSTGAIDLAYQESHAATPVVDGVFSISLGCGSGASGPFDASVFGSSDRWIEVLVDGEVLAPRQRLESVAYAFQAQQCVNAGTLEGQTLTNVVAQAQSGLGFSLLGGQIADAQVPASFARDAEVFGLVTASDGAGSTLDADLLDGLSSSAFSQFGPSIEAGEIASGAVVKSLNGLRDGVTLAAGPNVTITPAGNTLTLAAAGPDGTGPWALSGTSAYYQGGNVGIGTSNPLRTLQIGASPDALFTVEPGVSPDAGYIRFGDRTGWRLNFARSRESSGGPLNTGTTGFIMTIQDNGRVGIGDTSPDATLDAYNGGFPIPAIQAYSISGAPSLVVARGSNSGNLIEGHVSFPVETVFHITRTGTYVAGSDFAEALPARAGKSSVEPGDVLIASDTAPGGVERSSRPNDPRVVGVHSTRPGMLGADKGGVSRVDADDVPVAILGIVPTKVSTENGPLRVGDLLTTAATPGHAMRVSRESDVHPLGIVLGKALEPLEEGNGVIKVLVTLR
jgi:hypothetical protein